MQSIAQIAFFKDATDLDLARFERRCIWKKVDGGQTIIDFEDMSSDVYFLDSGHVRIQIRTSGGRELILADLRGGEFFGELSAIDGTPRSANVTALTQAVICIVGAGLFREMLAASPRLSEKLMRLLARRIRDLNTRLLEHMVLDIRHSLLAELLRLSSVRTQAAPARVISPPPFHHVLAARIGCRREQVTRELGALERDGLLQKTRGALILPDPEAIRARIAQTMQDAG
ncbi:MAG: Crp/Fnr family transcriptional regulator [Beijerinckiaceae bacterium]|nr:Crp/Fnr family transcriptional regulator [Beijerinckiaceae bacterium]